MSKIRVLVVDDAVVIRKLVSEELAKDPAIEVVGTAANGKIALARLPQLSPDLVILDVEMPEMDGLTALRELRKTYPRLPVIMFSSLTERGAAETLEALALGASDYFTKPTTGSLDASLEVLRRDLIPAIKALCGVGPRHLAAVVAAAPPRPAPKAPLEVVVIGTSTGGPNALAAVFAGLPRDFPVPILIVQHMPPMFTRLLAERLSKEYALQVVEGATGMVPQPGFAYLAPGDYHLLALREAGRVRLLLNQEPPENSCRPAADVLFRSVAKAYGPNALGVVMTGMGHDGLRGSEAIREAGGQILVQDEATSVVWGMPGAVAQAGLAERIIPLSLIAGEVVQRVRRSRG